MKITLKDGSVREYDRPMSAIEIACDISEGLGRMACLAEIDGEKMDLRTVIDHDASLNIFTARDPEGLSALRHTASHVMAQAVRTACRRCRRPRRRNPQAPPARERAR